MRTNDDDDGIDNDGYCRCRCDKYTSNPSMIDITVMPCTRYIQPLFSTDLPCTCTALSLYIYIYIFVFCGFPVFNCLSVLSVRIFIVDVQKKWFFVWIHFLFGSKTDRTKQDVSKK